MAMDEAVSIGLSQIDSMIDSMKRLNQLTIDIVGNSITNGLKAWLNAPLPCGTKPAECYPKGVPSKSVICPPEDLCLPRCILTVTRHARIGEVIIIPFKIRNRNNVEKTYQLGVRPFINHRGDIISQPSIDDVIAKIQPGQVIGREVRIDLGHGFSSGELYETDIVLREKTHNQNICLKLYTYREQDIPEAAPYDEKDLDMHFHRWYHHYYCLNPRKRSGSVDVIEGKADKAIIENAEQG